MAGHPAQLRPIVLRVLRAHGVIVAPQIDHPYYYELERKDQHHPILVVKRLPDIVHWDTVDSLRFEFNIPIDQFYPPRRRQARRASRSPSN